MTSAIHTSVIQSSPVHAGPVHAGPVRVVPAVGSGSEVSSHRPCPRMSPRPAPAVGVHDLLEVLARAQRSIDEAALVPHAADRYLAAQLAAQQVAGVVLAARGARLGRGPKDPWDALAAVAPECGEWAGYFAAIQPRRRAVAAGVRAIVSTREADDLVRDAQGFHDHVARLFHRCRQQRASGRSDRSPAGRGPGEPTMPGGD